MIVWIPTTESLPSVGVKVRVKVANAITRAPEGSPEYVAKLNYDKHWVCDRFPGAVLYVTHWAYLDPGSV